MSFSIALAQSNFMVGHISGNVARITGLHGIAATAKADLLVVSEMAVTGYPPEDLVLRKGFQEASMRAVEELAALTARGPAMLLGGLWCEGDALHNTAFLLDGGAILHRQHKRHLPNYGVFDEKRVFVKGEMPVPVEWHGVKLGLLICEDMWAPDVAAHLKSHGAELLISINASPFEMGKARVRREVAQARVRETGLPLLYVNQVGGQDELVFDGRGFALSRRGEVRARMRAFEEDFALVCLRAGEQGLEPEAGDIQPVLGEEETIYRAMALGLRDFVDKNGFRGAVLGMSGGIDSALTAAVAADALGPERVRLVLMPSPFTSAESTEDAKECADRLGLRMDTIAITPGMEAFHAMLDGALEGRLKDVTAENIQPRLRGAILMAISNNEGLMLLTTGNKSEMSVGYATLYGDMCGGYSVVKDVYKTTVYRLARWRNGIGDVIPGRILTKAPTAELKHGQTDQDTLPPYDLLDAILLRLVEGQLSTEEVAQEGYDKATVERVARMLYFAEYKRRQSPPGVKLTGMSFGRDRRYPITSGWRK
jgi:NAD+ synthase